MIAFSVISISIMMVIGIVMYMWFSMSTRQEVVHTSRTMMEQTGENLEDYLIRMRQISDVAYYNVVKENDFSDQSEKIQEGMNLLYEANRDNLRSIVIYNNYGSLLAAEPIVSQKEDPNVTKQEWVYTGNG